MWLISGVKDIQEYIDNLPEYYAPKIIAIVCANLNSAYFREKVFDLLPTYNFYSGKSMDFFWIGSRMNPRTVGDLFDLNDLFHSEEVRIREAGELASKLNTDDIKLIGGFKIVVLPVISKQIIYEEAVIFDAHSVEKTGINIEQTFEYLVEYAKSDKAFRKYEIEGRFNKIGDTIKSDAGNDILSRATNVAQDVISSVIAAAIQKVIRLQ